MSRLDAKTFSCLPPAPTVSDMQPRDQGVPPGGGRLCDQVAPDRSVTAFFLQNREGLFLPPGGIRKESLKLVRISDIFARRRVTDYLWRNGRTSEKTLVRQLDVDPELLGQLAKAGKIEKSPGGAWKISKKPWR